MKRLMAEEDYTMANLLVIPHSKNAKEILTRLEGSLKYEEEAIMDTKVDSEGLRRLKRKMQAAAEKRRHKT